VFGVHEESKMAQDEGKYGLHIVIPLGGKSHSKCLLGFIIH